MYDWIKSDIISSLDVEPQFIGVMIVMVIYLNEGTRMIQDAFLDAGSYD